MQMPVYVGIFIAVMVLVTFSTWFYNLAGGVKELVLDDVFFGYRIATATVLSIIFMVGAFFVIATVNECPNQPKEGLFAGLKCESYLRLKASADSLFQPGEKSTNEAL